MIRFFPLTKIEVETKGKIRSKSKKEVKGLFVCIPSFSGFVFFVFFVCAFFARVEVRKPLATARLFFAGKMAPGKKRQNRFRIKSPYGLLH